MTDRRTADPWRRLGIAAMSLVSIVSASLIWSTISSPVDVSPLAPANKSAGLVSHLDRAALLPLLQRSIIDPTDILRRPLFAPDRRPPRTRARETPKTDDHARRVPLSPPKDIMLRGVMSDPSRDRTALLTTKDRPEGRWLRLGDQLGMWEVAEIGVGFVILRRGDDQAKLLLYPPIP